MRIKNMTEEDWVRHFTEMKAFWLHDNNPKRPHALLTSGKHSNGFFNGSKVIEDSLLTNEVCLTILDKMALVERITRVIGSAFGAIDIAHEFGRIYKVKHGFTEPIVNDGKKDMLLKRFAVTEKDTVLIVEDVLTTGKTTLDTIAAVEKSGAIVLPVVCVIVNRSGEKELGERRVVSLIDRFMPTWTPEECPLCKKGSEAIRPKGNWDRLIADY